MAFDAEKIAAQWRKLGETKWRTAKGLFTLGHRADALFFCHLSMECKLKEMVTKKTNDPPPYTHDLLKLARMMQLEISEERRRQFDEMSTFNIRARYDDIKLAFHKKATKAYTEKYMRITESLLTWLSSKN